MVRPLTRDCELVTDVDEQQVLLALEGLSFPAGRHVVIAYATDRGGIGSRVLAALDRLPDAVFSSAADIVVRLPTRL